MAADDREAAVSHIHRSMTVPQLIRRVFANHDQEVSSRSYVE